MTTHLPSLDMGRTFIRTLSLLTFQHEARMAEWRSIAGFGAFDATNGVTSPDLRYWQHSSNANPNGPTQPN